MLALNLFYRETSTRRVREQKLTTLNHSSNNNTVHIVFRNKEPLFRYINNSGFELAAGHCRTQEDMKLHVNLKYV